MTDEDVISKLALAGLPFSYEVDVKPSWDKKSEIVIIEVRSHDVTFEDISKISLALGTTKINLGSEVREGGYCETCAFSYTIDVITVMDVNL